MTPERLLKHFETISDAPNAVARLRRFILDLAVRGKLVEQDPADEPAAELLERIEAEKEQLIKTGKFRRSKIQPVDVDEIPFDTPDGWLWSQLAQIGFVNPRNSAEDTLQASFVPMPMIFADYGQSNRHEVRSWGDIKKGFTHFAEGDVGLAKITPCFENGKSTVFRNLTGKLGAGTTELHIVRPIFVNADYILIFLKSPQFVETGIPKMTGTAGQKRVPKDYFALSPFPLPPLAEQHRIVAKVDELMALCDELEAKQTEREQRRDRLVAATLQGLNNPDDDSKDGRGFQDTARFYFNHLPRLSTRPEHVQQLRQTILNLAVRGKLVEQDPADEPARFLVQRIENVKKDLTRKRKTREAVTSNLDYPAGWEKVHFDQILLSLQTGPFGSSLHQQDYEEGGIPVINPASIQNEHIVPIAKMAVGPNTLERLSIFKVKNRDVVMGRRGEMGRCAVVTEKESGWLCGTGSLILRFTKDVWPWFIVKLMGAPSIREYLGGASVGATMQNLNQSILRDMPIGIPPLAEQQRIVAEVNELMALCDELETHLSDTNSARVKLLEATLQEALNGTAEAAVLRKTG